MDSDGAGSILDEPFGCASRGPLPFVAPPRGDFGGLLGAFCTPSKALFAAATADLTRATAFSAPAGAFSTAVSTIALNLAWASALVA